MALLAGLAVFKVVSIVAPLNVSCAKEAVGGAGAATTAGGGGDGEGGGGDGDGGGGDGGGGEGDGGGGEGDGGGGDGGGGGGASTARFSLLTTGTLSTVSPSIVERAAVELVVSVCTA